MMRTRPQISFSPTPVDKTVDNTMEAVGQLLLVGLWSLTLYAYAKLPNTIPTHFNGAGLADGFGDKATLFLLPTLATLFYAGTTAINKVINKSPHLLNYPVAITPGNAAAQYANAARMVRALKMLFVAVFTLLVFRNYAVASGQASGLGTWFLPSVLATVFVPMSYFVFKAFRMK